MDWTAQRAGPAPKSLLPIFLKLPALFAVKFRAFERDKIRLLH
jgi:hypothetical protein